jgi:triacylglycerol lipase
MLAAMMNIHSPALMRASVRAIWLAVAFVLSPSLAGAETLVLIQGFLGDGDGWRGSGVTHALEQAGWRDAGHLSLARGMVRSNQPPEPAIRRYYTIDLVTYAPLTTQARMLDRYIDFVREQHPYSALVLAGHSAGGVLARLYMVQHDEDAFAALVTIASPHLGTRSAGLGVAASERMLAWMADLFGAETLDFHWRLFRDLDIERPDNLLGWLNYQPHPPALYTSIVRQADDHYDGFGNLLVPAWSQDMNHVFALRGRARTVTVPGGHGLRAADGHLLVKILGQLQRV